MKLTKLEGDAWFGDGKPLYEDITCEYYACNKNLGTHCVKYRTYPRDPDMCTRCFFDELTESFGR